MLNRLKQFMYGRYGGKDELNAGLLIVWVIFAAVNIFVRSQIIYLLGLVFPILALVRALSKNITRRRDENTKFLYFYNKAVAGIKEFIRRLKEFGTHRYITCPACKATLRVPRRTGKHTVVCPKCRNRFEKRILF